MAKEYVVPVTWQMHGYVTVNAETPDEAMILARNSDDLPMPYDAKYMDGSMHVDEEANAEFIEMYTEAHENGELGSRPEPYEEE